MLGRQRADGARGGEQATDDIVAQVETRLGIATTVTTTVADEPTRRREPIALADDAPTTEYDLAEWEQSERDLDHVAPASPRELPFRWEEDVLLVGTDDEELVDAILDEVENGEYVELPDDDGDDDGEPISSRSRR